MTISQRYTSVRAMVSEPAGPQWFFRALSADEDDLALAFLQESPLLNVYFISRILDEGIGSRGQTAEIVGDGRTMALASLTSNLALAASENLEDAERSRAMEVLAERILSRSV